MFDAGILGSADHRCGLPALVGPCFPKVGDEENAVHPFERSHEGFRAIQICFDNFIGEFSMLARVAGQSAHLELAGLQGARYCAALVPRCADHGDLFFTHG